MSSVLGKIIETLSIKKPPTPRETASRERHAKGLLYPGGLSSARISSSRVRMVVFRDDRGVKQQLFDSQSHSENDEAPCSRSLCDMRSGEQMLDSGVSSSNSVPPGRSQFTGWNTTPNSAKTRRAAFIRRPSTDAELLGEMMFGSMPMKTVGSTVKVHYIRSTDQLMLTKVFTTLRCGTISQCALMPDYNKDSCPLIEPASSVSTGSYMSSVPKSLMGKSSHAHATKSLQQIRSVSPETSKHRSSSLSVPIMRPRCSGSSLSPSTSPPSPHSPQQLNSSNGISSSLTRRILRSRSTSLENGSELYRRVLKPLDECSSRKGKKYALGVIICLSELSKDDIRHFQSFLFSHFTLIDAHLERLKEAVEDSSHYRGNVVAQMLTKGYNTFLESFLSLYEAPRIESPVWLSLISEYGRQRSVCMQFMEELGSAVVELETKDTKFFLSSLLTAVLTHHLAWVYTVSKQGYDRHHKAAGKSLGVLAESHPYNPLWAQLSDMYGAVSHPLKIARTIITGQSLSVVCRLLYLLTYFIRCSEIQPGFVQVMCQELSDKDTSRSKPGSSEISYDCDNQSHDLNCAFGESDIFPVSRASSCTVVSDQEKCASSPAASPDCDTPVVKPHPFSFRTTPLSTTASSTDSYHRHHTTSEGECYEHTSDTARCRAVRSKSSSFNYSGEFSTSIPSDSLKTSLLIAGTVAKQHHMSILATGDRSTAMSTKSCSCNNRDHPVASEDGSVFNYGQFHCQCHYGEPQSCAFNPSVESMCFCPIDNGFLSFDPNCRYNEDEEGNSSDTVNRSLSRHSSDIMSPSSIQMPSSPVYTSTSTTLDCPYNQGPNETCISSNVVRTSCTSIDSGYEKSMSMPSFMISAKDPISLSSCLPPQTLYGSVSNVTTPSSVDGCKVGDTAKMKPRARSLCDMEQKKESPLSLHRKEVSTLCPESHNPVPQLVIEDLTITNHMSKARAHTTSDCSTPVAPLTKSATPSPGSVPTKAQSLSKVELRKVFFASKGRAKGIRTIEDSKIKQEQCSFIVSTTRPRSDAVCFTTENPKTKSSDSHMSSAQVAKPTISDENHVTSTPTYFGSRSLGNHNMDNQSHQPNGSWNMCISGHCPIDTSQCALHSQHNFSFNCSCPTFEPEIGTLSQYLPACFGKPNHSSFGTMHPSKSGLPLDNQSVVSETDSGHCTKSIDVDVISQASELSHLSYLDNTSECSEVDNYARQGAISQSCIRNQLEKNVDKHIISANPEQSFSASCLKLHHAKPSLLQEKLREYEATAYSGGRPSMLKQFEDFTDVELPTFDDFFLDDPHSGSEQRASPSDASLHRHRIGDFGHSLFGGHSPSYLPDFILHGTSEPANDEFINKLAGDLSNMVKHSIIDEPVDYGIGIIGDTDNWGVKIMSATKNLHTSDIIVGTGAVKPSQYVKQLLNSMKSMYEMRMPPEFCLSYLEDRLLELNERSQLLTKSLQENPHDADLAEILPHAVTSLNIDQSDVPLLLAVSAANCSTPDVSAYLNYQHMKMVLGKQFI